jgi:hypothetical protein
MVAVHMGYNWKTVKHEHMLIYNNISFSVTEQNVIILAGLAVRMM